MVVPVDVREIIGQTILVKKTGRTDRHRAALAVANKPNEQIDNRLSGGGGVAGERMSRFQMTGIRIKP